ncbi:hypothetical protein LCGC14_1553410 [marine sediment metagenome]|uniref:Uncharacterized protein n=1 Tax=marine sediment metagenome TaxID=412755 RepID=A0A0F9IPR9_9ZZZZ
MHFMKILVNYKNVKYYKMLQFLINNPLRIKHTPRMYIKAKHFLFLWFYFSASGVARFYNTLHTILQAP